MWKVALSSAPLAGKVGALLAVLVLVMSTVVGSSADPVAPEPDDAYPSPTEALAALATYFPLPGVEPSSEPAGAGELTSALSEVAAQWNGLTLQQQTQVRRLTTIPGSETSLLPDLPGEIPPGERRLPAGGGREVSRCRDAAQQLPDDATGEAARGALRHLRDQLGEPVGLPVVWAPEHTERYALTLSPTEAARVAVASAVAWKARCVNGEWHLAVRDEPVEGCVLTKGPRWEIARAAAIFAHEIFHCYQFRLAGTYARTYRLPHWVVEGSSTWVALDRVQNDPRGRTDFGQYIASAAPLFRTGPRRPGDVESRGNTAVGLFRMIEDSGIPVWPLLLPLHRKILGGPPYADPEVDGTVTAVGYILGQAEGTDFSVSVGSRAARMPRLGPLWNISVPGHDHLRRSPRLIDLAAGGDTLTSEYLGEPSVHVAASLADDVALVQVDFFHAADQGIAALGGREHIFRTPGRVTFCVEGRCRCPDGGLLPRELNVVPVAGAPASLELDVAYVRWPTGEQVAHEAAGGDYPTVSIWTVPDVVDQFCQPAQRWDSPAVQGVYRTAHQSATIQLAYADGRVDSLAGDGLGPVVPERHLWGGPVVSEVHRELANPVLFRDVGSPSPFIALPGDCWFTETERGEWRPADGLCPTVFGDPMLVSSSGLLCVLELANRDVTLRAADISSAPRMTRGSPLVTAFEIAGAEEWHARSDLSEGQRLLVEAGMCPTAVVATAEASARHDLVDSGFPQGEDSFIPDND